MVFERTGTGRSRSRHKNVSITVNYQYLQMEQNIKMNLRIFLKVKYAYKPIPYIFLYIIWLQWKYFLKPNSLTLMKIFTLQRLSYKNIFFWRKILVLEKTDSLCMIFKLLRNTCMSWQVWQVRIDLPLKLNFNEI